MARKAGTGGGGCGGPVIEAGTGRVDVEIVHIGEKKRTGLRGTEN